VISNLDVSRLPFIRDVGGDLRDPVQDSEDGKVSIKEEPLLCTLA